MIHALKGEKIVNGGDRLRITTHYHYLAPSGEIARSVLDLGAELLHLVGAGHIGRRVNKARNGEVATCKRRSNLAHVRANGLGPDRVHLLALKHDATSIRQRLEDV